MTVIISGTNGITAPGTETFGDGTALGGATNPIVSMAKGANNYVQAYIVNNTDGANASADIVCYPSNGTDSSGWIDMGITGPTFSQAAYGITGANEGYIFMSAPSGASKTGNLVLATDSTGTQNAIKFATGGFGSTTERMRIDSSGNLLVGATSADARVFAYSTTGTSLKAQNPSNVAQLLIGYNNTSFNYVDADNNIFRSGAGVERARIDTSGNLLVGQTTNGATGKVAITTPNGATGSAIATTNVSGTAQYYAAAFYNNGTTNSFCGGISVSGTTTTFATSSDYRLKENIAPMTGALDVVAQLKPCTYSWKSTGESTQGFIAHELQEVVPECVVGEKDAVDEGGNPRYQGIDTSFLVATLTAAIQELKAEFDEYKAAHP